jgi:hypothetical protein
VIYRPGRRGDDDQAIPVPGDGCTAATASCGRPKGRGEVPPAIYRGRIQSSSAGCRLQGRYDVVARDGGLAAGKLAVILGVKTAAGRASRWRNSWAAYSCSASGEVRCAAVAYPPWHRGGSCRPPPLPPACARVCRPPAPPRPRQMTWSSAARSAAVSTRQPGIMNPLRDHSVRAGTRHQLVGAQNARSGTVKRCVGQPGLALLTAGPCAGSPRLSPSAAKHRCPVPASQASGGLVTVAFRLVLAGGPGG